MRVIHMTAYQRLRVLFGRNVLVRLMGYCFVGLVVGTVVLYLAEHRVPNSEYQDPFKTVVNIVILFTSGFDAAKPETTTGTVAAFAVLAMGILFLGMFTGEMAAFLVERRMKGTSGMKPVNLSGHIVITRWSKDTEAIIDELMSDEIKEKPSIVVIDREAAQLPVNNPFVHFVKGDPAESAVLERAAVGKAATAIILSDSSSKDYNIEDSRSILTCLAVESMNHEVYTVVQILNPENRKHLERAHCDEIICTTEVSMRLVVQSSLNHGLSRVFGDILSFGDGSEVYRVKLGKRFEGKEYFELGSELMQGRISLLALDSGGAMEINPEKEVRVKAGDHAFVLAPEHPRQIED